MVDDLKRRRAARRFARQARDKIDALLKDRRVTICSGAVSGENEILSCDDGGLMLSSYATGKQTINITLEIYRKPKA